MPQTIYNNVPVEVEEKVYTVQTQYNGVWAGAFAQTVGGNKILVENPVILTDVFFSEHNEWTTDNTNIFATTGMKFRKENFTLKRAKYENKYSLENPRINQIANAKPQIMYYMNAYYEKTIAYGVIPRYGIINNPYNSNIVYSGAYNVDVLLNYLVAEVQKLVQTFGRGLSFALYLPFGWWANLLPTTSSQGTSPAQYVKDGLTSYVSGMGSTVSIYETEYLTNKFYIVTREMVTAYIGEVPQLQKTYNTEDGDFTIERYIFDERVAIYEKKDVVKSIDMSVPITKTRANNNVVQGNIESQKEADKKLKEQYEAKMKAQEEKFKQSLDAQKEAYDKKLQEVKTPKSN